MTEQEQNQVGEKQDHQPPFPYNNSPVTVTISEAIGIIAMSIMALILLIALLRAQARIRELQEVQGQQEAG
jgi:Ni/Fe-hydrogenase subunit HybB-like protein